ncbi:hypothetical protein KKC65_00435 [Patescibacteria group bacterium]|nr:hypothetical protein [Patescibacteria group bacterium]
MVILLGVSIAHTSEGEERIRLLLDIPLDLQFSTPSVKEVSNVFESIRNVPIHEDDPWGTPGVIAKNRGDAPWIVELRFLNLGVEVDLDPTVWKNYFDLSWNIGHWLMIGSDAQERNYTNAPGTEQRGYGAALTFWTPGYSRIIPGFRTEFHFENNWFVGAGFRKYDLEIITGYDRYDKLKHRSHTDIGEIFETSVFVGWNRVEDDSTAGFRVGANFNSYNGKDGYRAIDVETNKVSFFLSLCLSY